MAAGFRTHYFVPMKHFHPLLSAASFLVIAACGGEPSEAAQPQPDAAEVTEPAGQTTANEPEIGDPVPEPETSSLAQQAQRDAELEARGITEIGWEELMPEGEEERIAEMYQAQMARLYSGGGIAEGSAADQAIQIGTFNVVEELDGMKIRLPGYTVPFDYGSEAEISEFLLVPYYGACLHAPPPPPNQTVFVASEDKIKLRDLSQAVWIEGTIRTARQDTDLADAAYTIEMTGWEIYEY
jgi:uncharacterized protein